MNEVLAHVPGGATQDPFKILDRPFYAAPEFLEGAANAATWGRAARADDEIVIASIRELTSEEIAALPDKANGASNTAFKAVERLKPRHHEIARLMASGQKESEIAGLMQVSLSHLHRLKRSPAFQHLLAYYMAERDVTVLTMRDRLEHAASLGLDRVMERLEDDEAPIPINQLKDIAFGLLDRAGFNPTTKIAAVSATVTPADMAKLKEVRDAARAAATRVPLLEGRAEVGPAPGGRAPQGPTLVGQRLEIAGPQSQGAPVGEEVRQASQPNPQQLGLFDVDPSAGVVVPLF